ISPRVRMPRIDSVNVIEQLLRAGIILGIDGVIHQQEQTAKVIGIPLENGFERASHYGGVAGLISSRQTELELEILRNLFQSLLELPCCQRVIMLFERQISAHQIRIGK